MLRKGAFLQGELRFLRSGLEHLLEKMVQKGVDFGSEISTAKEKMNY